ncbi:MAG: multiheme c-type cytochrome [Spirochaetota bacterium]
MQYYDTQREKLKSQRCSTCHQEIYQQWQKSSHAKAFSNKLFYHAYLREPQGWCLNCHAPLWKYRGTSMRAYYSYRKEKEPIMAEGVNCATCHLRDGVIYTAKAPSTKAEQCIYPVKQDKALGETRFCANCHQFNFPQEHTPHVVYGSVPMQNVVQEFENTIWHKQGKTCQSCHYKFARHSKMTSHNREELAKNLQVRFAYLQDAEGIEKYVQVFVSFEKLGHHFPTGDLFRILEIRVLDANKRLVGSQLLQKSVRVADRKLLFDSTLKPKVGERGAKQEIWIPVKQKPKYCEVIYHYQGKIENRLRNKLSKQELQAVLFSQECFVPM